VSWIDDKMTLEELCRSLHDALVHTVNVYYTKREARFNISVWVGDLDKEDE
jgi:hypothetical protein